MKKLAFLLSLVLLLGLFAGCEQQAASTESTAPSTTAPPPTEPASTQQVLEAPEFSVQTDYSQYVPAESASKFSRLQADWMPDLVAREDYGKIYPFAGNLLYLIYDWGTDEYPSYRYGMIDEKGRIVADATYDAIEPLGITDINVYEEYVTDGYLPLWRLMRVEQGKDGSHSKKRYAFATLDGSFVTACMYSGIYGSRDGYVLATAERSDGSIRFDLYDLEGNIVFSSEKLSAIKEEGLKLLSACYSEDRFLLTCQGKEQGTLIYYYTDWQGTELMGPYIMATPFRDNSALVMLYPKLTYAFIDKQGEIRLELEGYDLYPGYGGLYIAEKEEQHSMILDRRGKVIYSADLEHAADSVWPQSGFIRHSCEDSNTYYDMEGNMLYGEAIPSSWNALGNGLFSKKKELVYWDSKKSFSMKSLPSAYAWSCFSYGLPYVVCQSGQNQDYILLNEELEPLADQDRLLHSYVMEDSLTGKHYLMLRTEVATWLYGENHAAPLRLPSEENLNLEVYGDRILYVSESRCVYYSLTGELIFSYPLGISGSD